MAYSTSAQVAEEIPGVAFSATSRPTESVVDRWIEEADQFIDSKVGLIYNTPIDSSDSPKSFKIVRTISIYLVAARVKEYLSIKNEVDDVNQKPKITLHKMAMDMLKQIVKRELKLPDSDLANTSAGVSSFNVSNNEKHTYKKNVDQW